MRTFGLSLLKHSYFIILFPIRKICSGEVCMWNCHCALDDFDQIRLSVRSCGEK